MLYLPTLRLVIISTVSSNIEEKDFSYSDALLYSVLLVYDVLLYTSPFFPISS